MKVKVPCTCYAPVDFEYEEVVDLAKNPEAANQIMAGSFMKVKCPKCGKVLHPEFPFVVKYEPKNIDIQFLPERMRDDYLRGTSKYCFKKDGRIAIGLSELAEKLKIINEGFDDRIIEVIKYYMVSKIEADQKPEAEIRAFFECTDKDGNLVYQVLGLKDNEVAQLTIPKSFYEVCKVKTLAYKNSEPFSLFLSPPYISLLRISRVYEEITEPEKPADKPDEDKKPE
ncbi:MAG: hypothetical protein IJQ86_07275 [Spirochaetia bacterium]|nr:hypothetical protein [Spirochaetia bacterium]